MKLLNVNSAVHKLLALLVIPVASPVLFWGQSISSAFMIRMLVWAVLFDGTWIYNTYFLKCGSKDQVSINLFSKTVLRF